MFISIIFTIVLVGVRGESDWDEDTARRNLFALGRANNHFAVNLHRKLAEETEGNVFFSPFSVSSALTMLYRGARSETQLELRKVLGYGRLNDSVLFSSINYYLSEVIERIDPKLYTINCISAMVVDRSFPVLQDYKSDIRDIFQAYVQEANIAEESAAVVDKMNTWAKIKTKGAICDLADVLYPDTVLFLASAAYFKGTWKVKFDEEDTKYHPFYNRGDRTNASNVLMMHAYATFRYYESEDDDFTAVELFYEGRNMSMVIYLPNEMNGLHGLEDYLTAPQMSFLRRQMYYMKVHLTMPKFKLEYHTSLSSTLQAIGITRIFRAAEADLSGMIGGGSTVALNDVKHKALIEINEQGSIAAAITRAIMTKSMPLPIPDPEFKVDRPFLFAVFDSRNGMILFMGRVTCL